MDPPVLMNIKKIQRLMRKYGLSCPIRKAKPYRRMAKALKTDAVSENLLNRQFKEHGPRKVLLTDITYIPCCGVFFYLSAIKDAYTMQILAYVLSESLEIDFVLETVNRLISNYGQTLIVKHSFTLIKAVITPARSSAKSSKTRSFVSPCQDAETVGIMRRRKASSGT